MNSDDSFDKLIREAESAHFQGWDFSWLAGRKTEIALPWDYAAIVKERMACAGSMLDMGTGGGERLAALAPFPARTCATEGYGPNVKVARDRLESFGVQVIDTTNDPENRRLPFRDCEFDLVVNRHETYVPEEIARVLRPGGTFVTQQCAAPGPIDLIAWFKGAAGVSRTLVEEAARQIEEGGLTVKTAQEACPATTFADIGAVVYYLKAIPWVVEGFNVEKHRHRLLALHEYIREHDGFTSRDFRFLVEAVSPS